MYMQSSLRNVDLIQVEYFVLFIQFKGMHLPAIHRSHLKIYKTGEPAERHTIASLEHLDANDYT